MKVLMFPADASGCGMHRMIWPGRMLIEQGHDVEVVMPGDRQLQLLLNGDRPYKVILPKGVDVVVLQRVTNRYMAQAIPVMRNMGIAVVVDIDDDLTSIDPRNPAFAALHPRNEGKIGGNGKISLHSWHHLTEACQAATMVTCSTRALVGRYATPDRARVLANYLAPHYYGIEHTDSDVLGWPAALMSHPGDPAACGNAIARLVNEMGVEFMVTASPKGVARAFGLSQDPEGVTSNTSVEEWPHQVNRIGVGIAPLVDTRFNASKSWLKPLEMCALGVPWVASPRAEYARLHDYGAGLLADNKREWYRHLKALVSSPEMRAELAGQGRDLADKLRLELHAYRWWEAWEDALALEHGLATSSQHV